MNTKEIGKEIADEIKKNLGDINIVVRLDFIKKTMPAQPVKKVIAPKTMVVKPQVAPTPVVIGEKKRGKYKHSRAFLAKRREAKAAKLAQQAPVNIVPTQQKVVAEKKGFTTEQITAIITEHPIDPHMACRLLNVPDNDANVNRVTSLLYLAAKAGKIKKVPDRMYFYK